MDVRVIFDATHGVLTDFAILVRDHVRCPTAVDIKAWLWEQAREGGSRVALVYDIAQAHRQILVLSSVWGRLACQLEGTAAATAREACQADDASSRERPRARLESAAHVKREMRAGPGVGVLLPGVIGGLEAPPGVGVLLAGVEGNSRVDSTDVVEVFSPERVGQVRAKFGLVQGAAMDFKSGYDFDHAADRARCWAKIEQEKPMLVIVSPPCRS